MRNTFPGYYRPTEDEFAELWTQCLFVLDANVLLNLYCYSQETRDELIGILGALYDSIWLPHQAALEYHRHRLGIINQQAKAYQDIQKLSRDVQEEFTKRIRTLLRRGRHPFIAVDSVLEKLNSAFTEICENFDELEQRHPDFFADDPILEAVTNLFEGKVGSAYTPEQLQEIYAEGKVRYTQEPKIPPGYEDASKDGDAKQYGDLVLWFQVIDQAKATGKPIILVTDDRKEDWWWRSYGKTHGPRPELVNEITRKANVGFYMYSADPFMEYASEYLEYSVKKEAIEEVRDVRERDEENIANLEAIVKAIDTAALRAEMTPKRLGPYAALSRIMDAVELPSLDAYEAMGRLDGMGDGDRLSEATVSPYVGNTTSRRFHLSSCQHAQRTSLESCVFFASREEAVAQGFSPCKVCAP
jgi:hypothetical protein